MVKVVPHNRLQWYGQILGKDDDDDCVKMCLFDGRWTRQTGSPRKTEKRLYG